MPKKKTGNEIAELLKSGQLMKGSDPRLDMRWLPTGIPQLDAITGGGIPYNRNVGIVGPESTGKNILCQYIAAAVQKTDRPNVLLMDLEHSFDREWWVASGVDPKKLFVSQPLFGEAAIDIMVTTLQNDPTIGGVILDSIPAMVPKAVVEAETAGDKFVGRLPVLVNQMLAMVTPLLQDCVFVHTNQMRANIGGYEEIHPGGKGLQHATHIRLRTRRDGWIKDGTQRVGFPLEVICSKNKCGVPYGECQINFSFRGQLDLVQSYLDEAIQQKVITERLPYYRCEVLGGLQWMGKAQMREYFVENKGALELVKAALKQEAS